MGFDAGYGIGSVKPGVATSSTRPASPFDGQVIYETDTNVVSVYDGAAWATVGPAAASGLVLISRTTPAAATTLAFDGVFSSTYSAYLISLQNLETVSGGSVSFNVRYGSTTNTNAHWYGVVFGAVFDNTAYSANATNGATSFLFGSSVHVNGSAMLNVSGVGAAGLAPSVLSQEEGGGYVRTGAGHLRNTSQTWTGFILSSASNISGTIAIYGLASA